MSIRRTTINGLETAYRLEGCAGRPVVMFANSLAADMSMWDAQAADFGERYRVLRYDMRGHGGTDEPSAPFSIADLADDAVALLDALEIDRAHFVGLSLGGMVGQVLGASHGARLTSLTLCATAYRMDASIWRDRIERVEREGTAPLVPATLERWFTAGFRASRPDLMETVAGMIAATSRTGYASCARAIGDMNLEPLLGRIARPTLVIAGAQDLSTPPEMARRIHDGIGGSELVIVENAAHLMNIEQPQAFDAALETFLGRHEQDSLTFGKPTEATA